MSGKHVLRFISLHFIIKRFAEKKIWRAVHFLLQYISLHTIIMTHKSDTKSKGSSSRLLVLCLLKLFNLDLFVLFEYKREVISFLDQQGHGDKSTFAYRSSSSTRVSHAICCLNRSHWSVSFSQHENMTMHSCLSVFVWAVREGFN